jgi:hypothetical protein
MALSYQKIAIIKKHNKYSKLLLIDVEFCQKTDSLKG